jgi:hypothetical protein
MIARLFQYTPYQLRERIHLSEKNGVCCLPESLFDLFLSYAAEDEPQPPKVPYKWNWSDFSVSLKPYPLSSAYLERLERWKVFSCVTRDAQSDAYVFYSNGKRILVMQERKEK